MKNSWDDDKELGEAQPLLAHRSESSTPFYFAAHEKWMYQASFREIHAERERGFRLVFSVMGMALCFVVVVLLYSPFEVTDNSEQALYEATLYREGYEPLIHFMTDSANTVTYGHLSNYLGIVEPYVTMHLFVNGYDVDAVDDISSYYVYDLCKDSVIDSSESCQTGLLVATGIATVSTQGIIVNCTPGETYTLTAKRFTASNNSVLSSLSGEVLCSYVRREIRSLTDEDLDSMLDAMYEMWVTDEETGQLKYGANYHYFSYFSQWHHFHSAWVDADHFHEGVGFLTQHIRMTNTFELSMQAVNPAVSLPYWDYTIEVENGDSVFDSFVFTAKTFGSITRPNNEVLGWTYSANIFEDAAIPDGRWAYIQAPQSSLSSPLHSNFGYLRSPWNSNPSKYISRFAVDSIELPSCSSYYSWMNTNSLADFLYISSLGPHSTTHGAIGDLFGCDYLSVLVDAGIAGDRGEALKNICLMWGFVMKELYRRDLIAASSSCRASFETREDGIEVVSDYHCTATCTLANTTLYRYVLRKVLVHWASASDDQWDYVIENLICGNGTGFQVFEGDHLESGSPSDPSFWPIHPSLERAFQARLQSGGFEESDWPSNSTTELVCKKSYCYELVDGSYTPGYYPECCDGHYSYNSMLDFVNENRSAWIGETNEDTITSVSPDTYNVSYIYDHFNWDHCSEDFTGMLQAFS